MKLKKAITIGLCTVMVLQSLSMVSLADFGGNENEEHAAVSLASPSDADRAEEEAAAETQEEEKITAVPIKKSRNSEATPSDAVYVSDETELKQAVKHSGAIIVSNDISLTDTLVITDGVSVELSGGTVSFAGDKTVRNMIAISGGAKVKLQDFTLDATELNDMKNNNVIWMNGGSKISYLEIDGDTTILTANKDTSKKNDGICGIWVGGKCQIESGTISGFSVGLVVDSGSELVINNIDLVDCHQGIGVIGKNKNNSMDGSLYLNGGTICGKGGGGYGILNRGRVYMTGGTITKHYSGILNCNSDALSHEEFAPVAELSGGEISGNLRGAIINQIRGTVIITGDVNISGKISMSDKMRSLAAKAADNKQTAVVSNENALLKIQGGTVTAAASGETAILNDEKGIVEMTAGEIIASGEQSYALQNANRTAGDVKVTGGSILATSESSHAIDNQGYMEITEDVVVSSKEEKQVLISVSYNDGGTVTPGTGMVEINQTLEFLITPDSGYKIESVEFDGVNQPNPYKLEVDEKNHFVRVNFIEVSSDSHGSSSSGGGSSRSVKSVSKPEFPETPGMWKQTEKGWQYIDAGGNTYVNTWIYKDGKWYWLEEDGVMAEGWKLVNNHWYYLTPVSGDMMTGWFFDGISWYYLDESGVRKTGWVQVSGKWYFMDNDGKMVSGTTTPDGYNVDAAGVWVQ